MIFGVGMFFAMQSDAIKCNSDIGQFGQTMSKNAEEGCQLVNSVQSVSAILVVIGIGALIGGFVMKPENRFGKIILGVVLAIILSIGASMIFPFPFGLIIAVISIGIIIWRIRKNKFKKGIKKEDSNSLEILKERYAKGEITKEEFDRMKEDLK